MKLISLIRTHHITPSFGVVKIMNEIVVGNEDEDRPSIEEILNGLRQGAIINDYNRISAIMNTLRIDKSYFTNYIDYTAINNTRQLAIMNDDWIVVVVSASV